MPDRNIPPQFQNPDNRKHFGRREFLLASAAAGLGVAGVALLRGKKSQPFASSVESEEPRPTPPDISRVVVVGNEKVFSETKEFDADQADRMLAAGMATLFAVTDPVAAWRDLFKPDDIVGIKVNCIAGPELSTHPRLASAIASQLQQAGVPAQNIIIWDRTNRELTRAGYTVNTAKTGVKCYGTDAVGYEENAASRKSFNGRLSKILTRDITALINVPILKNHGGAGVTISMKNHYGSFHNPSAHHKNQCDPCIADLNSLDEIRSKTRLIVCDATRATCNGGPGYNAAFAWRHSTLLFSQDPVALDTIGTGIIEERREKVSLPRLQESGRYPRQLASAAERGLGNTDLKKIELRTATL